MPCPQSPRGGEEQTPKCPLRARREVPESEAEDGRLSDSRDKPTATRTDWQAGSAALRLGSRKFRTRRADESRSPQSRSALRLDPNEPRTSDRSADFLATAIRVHPASRAVSDSSENAR